MEELSIEQKNKLLKLADFLQKSDISPSLPIVEELRSIGEQLDLLLGKEKIELQTIHNFPEPVEEVTVKNFPEKTKVEVTNLSQIPKIDISETNNLLKQILDKENNEDIEVIATLELV